MYNACKDTIKDKILSASCLIVLLMLSATLTMAQKQQGYVKTKGRLGQNGKVIPGTRLPGATIMLLGGSSTSSTVQGSFSLKAVGGKFTLQKVMKEGYELMDAEALKTYKCSENPLILTMVDRLQQRSDKSNAARLVRNQLNNKIDRQREKIEQLRAESKLTEAKYQEALTRLLDMEDSNHSLVEKMAEEYSKIDYDLVDDLNRQFNAYFLAGELEKADSLLKTRGNIHTDVADLKRLQRANTEVSKALKKSKAMEARKLSDLAERCYKQYELFLMQHQMDSAAYYIELRAQLDTTNVRWQLNAGNFINDYLANIPSAMQYLQTALSQALAQHGKQDVETADCYNAIGSVLYGKGNYDQAMQMMKQALGIRQATGDSLSTAFAKNLHDIGFMHFVKGNFDQALESYTKALSIWQSVCGEGNPDVCTCYTNIGSVYKSRGDYAKALEYYLKSRDAWQLSGDMDSPNCIINNGQIAVAYFYLGNYSKAIEIDEKTLEQKLATYRRENHPSVADTYNSLGAEYYRSGDYTKGANYMEKSLSILMSLYGAEHPGLIRGYSNLGTVYREQGNLEKALEYYHKALAISKSSVGENHPSVAQSYSNIGKVLLLQGEIAKALDILRKALSICEQSGSSTNKMLRSRIKADIERAESKLSEINSHY